MIAFKGSETTATTLSNLFFLLMSHPRAYARLQAEVDKFYPADEDSLNIKYHGDMPYLNACMSVSDFLIPFCSHKCVLLCVHSPAMKRYVCYLSSLEEANGLATKGWVG